MIKIINRGGPQVHTQINLDLLPPNLTHLTFGIHFNLPLDHHLPPSLTHLTFENNFQIPEDLPREVSSRIDHYWNHPLDNLPSKLTHLVLPANFNSPILLPSTLTHLTASSSLSINSLPHSLIHLEIGTIEREVTFPPFLTYLRITRFQRCVSLTLPEKLTEFQCYESFPAESHLPDSITSLTIRTSRSTFPPNLKHLTLIEGGFPVDIKLPPSLETLHTRVSLENPLPPLPPNLKTLKSQFNSVNPPSFPSNLTVLHLMLGPEHLHSLQSIFSLPNLTSLWLDARYLYNKEVCLAMKTLSLPPKLKDLYLEAFSVPIDFTSAPLESVTLFSLGAFHPTLPHTVHTLDLHSTALKKWPPFVTSLTIRKYNGDSIPPTLTQLDVSYHMTDWPINLPRLPDSLISLRCRNCQPLSFPPKLEHITLNIYRQPLPPLPSSLRVLELKRGVEAVDMPVLPPSLRELHAVSVPLTRSTIIPPLIKTVWAQNSGDLPEFPPSLENLQLF